MHISTLPPVTIEKWPMFGKIGCELDEQGGQVSVH